MTRRWSRPALFACAAALALTAAYGCSSDYGDEDVARPVVPGVDAAPDVSVPTVADGAASDPGDAGDAGDAGDDIPDSGVRTDAEAAVADAGLCASRPRCDCDEDGYAAVGCDAGAGVDASPGDCDDLDPLRRPGAGFVQSVPTGHAGDWSCDGIVERAVPSSLKCNPPTGLPGFTTCQGGGKGFLGIPACGTVAELYACPQGSAGSASDCGPKPTGEKAPQACK